MAAPLSRLRRALIATLVLVLGLSGAVVVTSTAQAAVSAPILSLGSLIGNTTNFTTANVFVEDGVDMEVSVWYLEPGVSDPAARQLFCTITVTAAGPAGGNCGGTVPSGELGIYTFFATADDGTGESPASPLSSFRYGESASSVPLVVDGPLGSGGSLTLETPTVEISGTAPAMSRVEVRATSVNPLTFAIICAVDPVPVSGEFSCSAALPLPTYGQWTVTATARDVNFALAADPPNYPYTVVIAPPEPLVAAAVTAETLTATVDGAPGSNVGAEMLLNGFGTSTSAGFCPATWTGSPLTPPTDGPTVACTFTGLPAGVHILESAHFLNATATLGREDAIYVPATPTLAVEPVPGGAIFRGTVDPLSDQLTIASARLDALEVVVRDAADQVVCTADADLSTGAWECGAELESGTDSFSAEARAVGFGFNPDAFGEVDGYIGGTSSATPSVATSIPAATGVATPEVSYELGAASISVDAVGLPNSAIQLDLYRVEVPPGDEYQYGASVGRCGLQTEDVGEGGPIGGIPPTSPSVVDDCVFTGLEPGIWNIYGLQYYYYDSSGYIDHYVMIPEAPSLTVIPSGPGQVVASGTGDPGYRVQVRQLGGAAACATTVTTGGTWSCTVTGLAGDVLLRAQQQSQGFVADPPTFFGALASYDGFSAWTAPRAVTVPVAGLPAVDSGPLVWILEGYDGGDLTPGQQLSLRARGLPVGTDVVIEIRSTPQVLGSAVADALGEFALDVTVPEDLAPGEHTLVGIATPPGGVASVIEIPVTVVAPASTDDDLGSGAPDDDEPVAAPDGAGTSAGDRSDPAAPSAITSSIPTLQRLFDDPWVFAAGGGLALALLLLVAFPAELLNSTLSSNTGRLGRWFVAIERRAERATEWFTRVSRTRALAAAVLVGLTSLIFGFVDPEYGFDPVSVRMTVSLAIGLFLITYVSAWISGAIARRAWGLETQVTLQPVALLFAVVGVVVARILEFSPGFLIGLVIGLDLLSRVDAAVRARVVVLSTSVTVGIAVAAWFGFSALTALSSGTPGWVELLISDALVATTAEGLTAAMASLLPLGFLAGHEVFRHSKPLWAGTFIVVATLFALIVLPTAAGETAAVEDMAFWMLVMAIFAAVTLTLWALLQFTGTRSGESDDDVVDHEAAAASTRR
ncbi:MAG: hypothetical protein LDL15_05690 [Yonghaparkia sp.]|nr:hypothetical protein [Microcella sp.]